MNYETTVPELVWVRTSFVTLAALTVFSGCSNDRIVGAVDITLDYQSAFAIKDLRSKSLSGIPIDILWVVDNGKSMRPFQDSIAANTQGFLLQFAQIKGLDWKMGLISTSSSQAPFLGFSSSSAMDSTIGNPAPLFQSAMHALATTGNGPDQELDPIVSALTKNPDFLRSNSMLAVIIVTNAPDKSSTTAQSFIRSLTTITGDLKRVVTFGVMAAQDLNCAPGTTDGWNYKGSKFETAISTLGGKEFSLCSSTFGTDLEGLAASIVLSHSTADIALTKRPVVSTIVVSYEGMAIPAPGWTYAAETNSIHFPNLNWATDLTHEVQVSFQSQGL